MKEHERPIAAFIAGMLTKRLQIGKLMTVAGEATIRDWTLNKETKLDVQYLSGKEVKIYNSVLHLEVNHYRDFSRDDVKIRIFHIMDESEITFDRIRFDDNVVEGYTKKNFRFRIEIEDLKKIRMYDDEHPNDQYKGYREYQIDF